jgi:hypothetical protein
MVPGGEGGGGRGMGRGNECGGRWWKGANTSDDLKDVVLLDAVKVDSVVNDNSNNTVHS